MSLGGAEFVEPAAQMLDQVHGVERGRVLFHLLARPRTLARLHGRHQAESERPVPQDPARAHERLEPRIPNDRRILLASDRAHALGEVGAPVLIVGGQPVDRALRRAPVSDGRNGNKQGDEDREPGSRFDTVGPART
ncbi:hypothetical protein [Cryptosporangium aurantiacum]|uniref:Uncharacterized protein n=1 Tax=Cryptosporangium aurantiacum TaxID=134849 RepID=A0A1M7RNG0_9ACTN|nr:hypothetical protein [Cryptosporangium aurantiacum]SHN47749.1 hypothetical protein SAMN05443668_12752 [Cryptosporangium aurantiacum]